jgi:hypothetical protein
MTGAHMVVTPSLHAVLLLAAWAASSVAYMTPANSLSEATQRPDSAWSERRAPPLPEGCPSAVAAVVSSPQPAA